TCRAAACSPRWRAAAPAPVRALRRPDCCQDGRSAASRAAVPRRREPQAPARRQPELGPERVRRRSERASRPELVRALEPASRQAPALALQQERALARARPAVVGPALSWLEERVSRPATCRAVR